VSTTSTASIPVTQNALEVARRSVAEFTDRGVPVPALLELIAHSTPGHQITATELPARNAAGHDTAPALLARR